MIGRRGLLAVGALGLAGCGLSERPFAERRQWPLQVIRPTGLLPRNGGPVLEVRDLLAGPGLETRGLQTLQADGSIRVAFYEEWAVPPAQALEDGLRQWLAQAGLFAAVAGPGSRIAADLAFDGTLTAFWADPSHGLASATIAYTVIDLRPVARRVVVQSSQSASVALPSADAADIARALRDAAAAVFRQIEAELAGVLKR